MLNKVKIAEKIRQMCHNLKSIESVFFKIIIAIAILIITVGIFYILSIALMFLLALSLSIAIISYVTMKIKGKKYKGMFGSTSRNNGEKYIKIIKGKVDEE